MLLTELSSAKATGRLEMDEAYRKNSVLTP